MNDKIQQLIPILVGLKDSWEFANPLLEILQSWAVTEEKLDNLIRLLNVALEKVKWTDFEIKFLFILELLRQIQEEEQKSRMEEQRQALEIITKMPG